MTITAKYIFKFLCRIKEL